MSISIEDVYLSDIDTPRPLNTPRAPLFRQRRPLLPTNHFRRNIHFHHHGSCESRQRRCRPSRPCNRRIRRVSTRSPSRPYNAQTKSKKITSTNLPDSIGSGCARSLAAIGVNLALHYSSSREKCETLATSLREEYPNLKISTHRADMASAEETEGLVAEAAKEHGMPPLVLVVNAGTGKRIPHIK